ncbi:GvpL/GvpF family gas vesicle protein [Pirellulaceae bacterium SH501]
MVGAIYLLGFSDSASSATESYEVLSGFQVEYLDSPPVRSWYCRISEEDLQSLQQQDNLSNLQWLTPRVLAHEAAVELLHQSGPFYPSRFGVLFESIESLERFAHRHSSTLTRFFVESKDRDEWGVKIFADWSKASDSIVNAKLGEWQSTDGSGTNYLRLKQKKRELESQLREWVVLQARGALEPLLTAFPIALERSAGGAMEGDAGKECVIHFTFSVHRSDQDAWARILSDVLSRDGFVGVEEAESAYLLLKQTGPWPLYSFCPSLQ